MTHVGDRVIVMPDGSGGYLVRTGGDPQVNSKVVVVPTGNNMVPVVAVSNQCYVGSKVIIQRGDGGQWFVLMAEGGGTSPDGDDSDILPGPEGEPPGSFHMVSCTPYKNETGVSVGKTVEATFNYDVFYPTVIEPTGPYDEVQVTMKDEYNNIVGGFADVVGTVIRFDPVTDLAPNRQYAIKFGRYIRNTYQQLLYKEYNIPFTTGTANVQGTLPIFDDFLDETITTPNNSGLIANGVLALYNYLCSANTKEDWMASTIQREQIDIKLRFIGTSGEIGFGFLYSYFMRNCGFFIKYDGTVRVVDNWPSSYMGEICSPGFSNMGEGWHTLHLRRDGLEYYLYDGSWNLVGHFTSRYDFANDHGTLAGAWIENRGSPYQQGQVDWYWVGEWRE